MKLRSILAAAALVLLAVPACEQVANLGEAQISVTPNTVTLPASGEKSETVALLATREWRVDYKPDWVILDKTSGKASTVEQLVTVSADPNKGNNREDEILFTIGLAKASLKVVQEGEKGVIEKGDGTLEKPFSVAGAIEYCQSLGADVQSTNNVYIHGIVSSVTTTYEASGSYGNATFYIVDNEGDTDQFYVFQTLYLGNKKWTSGNPDIKVNDDVIICGKVVNYKGNTPETVSKGGSFVYSLNGKTEGGGTEVDPGTPKGNGTLDNPYNPAGATAFVKTLAADTQTTEKYYIKGKVSKVATTFEGSGSYGNASFYIVDETDGKGEFYIFQTYYLGNRQWKSGDAEIKVDDVVIVYGPVVNYKGNTPETAGKGASFIYSLNGKTEGGNENPPAGEAKGSGTLEDPYNADGVIAFIKTLEGSNESANDVYVKGKISSVKYSFDAEHGTATFNVSDDGTTSKTQFTCYGVLTLGNQKWVEGNTQIAVNDDVIICGKVYNYNGNTPETVSGKAYIYSLNGKTSDTVSDVFGVEKTEISVGASATTATINVTGNVAWTASSTDATVAPESGTGKGAITVTFPANESTEAAKTYTVVVSTTANVDTKSYTVKITQAAKVQGGGSSYVLDGAAIKAAHTSAWSYTSGEKKVTATDGSEWILFNTYASTNQVTVQMNKGKSAYVRTPIVPEGYEIKTIAVVLNTKNDGSGNVGDRPMDIIGADGSVVLNDVSGQSLADGLAVGSSGHRVLQIICDETNGGAVYITSITITYGAK